jgi:hypothetical protein
MYWNRHVGHLNEIQKVIRKSQPLPLLKWDSQFASEEELDEKKWEWEEWIDVDDELIVNITIMEPTATIEEFGKQIEKLDTRIGKYRYYISWIRWLIHLRTSSEQTEQWSIETQVKINSMVKLLYRVIGLATPLEIQQQKNYNRVSEISSLADPQLFGSNPAGRLLKQYLDHETLVSSLTQFSGDYYKALKRDPNWFLNSDGQKTILWSHDSCSADIAFIHYIRSVVFPHQFHNFVPCQRMQGWNAPSIVWTESNPRTVDKTSPTPSPIPDYTYVTSVVFIPPKTELNDDTVPMRSTDVMGHSAFCCNRIYK